MANNLFRKLISVIRKQNMVSARVVPFGIGRIYACAYKNWHHDPRPMLFIIGSDAFYTIAINMHYLGSLNARLIQLIINMRKSTAVLTGLAIYRILKFNAPQIVHLAIRKYFTPLLRGTMVSDGISTIPTPGINKFLADYWVKKLNNLIYPKKLNIQKIPTDEKEVQNIRRQAIQSVYYRDKQKPFANRRMIQYRQPENTTENEE